MRLPLAAAGAAAALAASLVATAVEKREPGPHAEAAAWLLDAAAPAAKLGQPATLTVDLRTRSGFHLNDDYPLNVRATPSPALDSAKPRVDRDAMSFTACDGDATHRCAARIPFVVTPRAAGKQRVPLLVAFSACDPSQCLIEKIELTVPLEVAR